MTGWIIAFGLAILAMAVLCFIGRIPRVTREGVPLCGNPPSGQRVPAVEASPDAPETNP